MLLVIMWCAGLVETSSNLASVKLQESVGDKAAFVVQCSTRSSMMPALQQVRMSLLADSYAGQPCYKHLTFNLLIDAGPLFYQPHWALVWRRGGAGTWQGLQG
jgi:hypothetical protein